MSTTFLTLKAAAGLEPATIRRNVDQLAEKSRDCAVLARSCVTDEAREALLTMAEDYRQEAQELELALSQLTQLCAEANQPTKSVAS